MFKTTISNTQLTSDAANGFFQNINGDAFQNDISFLATLRALLAPRISEDESIYLHFTGSSYRADQISNVPISDCVSAIANGMRLDSNGRFIVHNFRADQTSNLACMKVIEEGFTKRYAGYYPLEKMPAFFKKSFPALCYVNPDRKNAILFVESLDIKKMHYLQMSILPALPWYFNPEAGVSELEMELIQSLKERTSEKYEACIKAIATQYDFRSARIRQQLAGFEHRYERLECDRVQQQITAVDNEINRLNEAIGTKYGQRNEFCIRLLGLRAKMEQNDGDSEIMEYFLCNDRLYLEQVTDTDMYFCVFDYLSYFDKDIVERMLANKRSFIYTCARGTIAPDSMSKLIRAIFIDESLRLKFCAAYRFNLNGNVSAISDHTFPSEFSDYMPNTHINRFSCMGGNAKVINSLLMDRNYIGALEQCVASCKSLNWGDGTVIEKFIINLYGSSKRCIELPDGTAVKPAQAVKWIEEQEAAHGAQEQEAEASE